MGDKIWTRISNILKLGILVLWKKIMYLSEFQAVEKITQEVMYSKIKPHAKQESLVSQKYDGMVPFVVKLCFKVHPNLFRATWIFLPPNLAQKHESLYSKYQLSASICVKAAITPTFLDTQPLLWFFLPLETLGDTSFSLRVPIFQVSEC